MYIHISLPVIKNVRRKRNSKIRMFISYENVDSLIL